MSKKVLLIGCGNIGALYDYDNQFVQTHAKALSMQEDCTVSVFDKDFALMEKVARKYNYLLAGESEEIRLGHFDYVVIASPTSTHVSWLEKCFKANVPLVICEKPIAMENISLDKIVKAYNGARTKVLVNYFRRFQPVYQKLRKKISETVEKPVQIVVTYQRGLVNNFSHAADLLQYFFGQGEWENVVIISKNNDAFENDPTASFSATYNGIPLQVTGLEEVRFSYFNIQIFYQKTKISFNKSGSEIVIEKADNFVPPYSALTIIDKEEHLLNEHMLYVYKEAKNIYMNGGADNFVEAIDTNRKLLELI